MYLLDPAAGVPTPHSLDPSTGTALRNYVLTLCADRTGGVWVGTRSGLYHWDPHRKPFRHLAVAPPAPVMALREADDGLWIGTLGAGLLRLGADANVTAHVRAGPGRLPSDLVWALYADPAQAGPSLARARQLAALGAHLNGMCFHVFTFFAAASRLR